MLAAVNDALALGARALDIDVRCEAASTFCALSINDDNKLDMAKDDQIIQVKLTIFLSGTLLKIPFFVVHTRISFCY